MKGSTFCRQRSSGRLPLTGAQIRARAQEVRKREGEFKNREAEWGMREHIILEQEAALAALHKSKGEEAGEVDDKVKGKGIAFYFMKGKGKSKGKGKGNSAG